MAGRPERAHGKVSVRASVPADVYEHTLPLASWPLPFRSFSQFFEALAFSLKASFAEMPGDDMPKLMRDIKAQRLLALDDLTRFPTRRELHMTLDEEAVEFIDCLCSRFPVVFGSRNETATLMLLYAARFRADDEAARYLGRRLHEALNARPGRKASAKARR